MQIEFKDISNFSSLFIDFINDSEKVKSFFPSNYDVNIEGLFNLRLNQTSHFKKLYKQIIKDSVNFELSTKQLHNFELSDNRNTLFVITGQQPGIFGGPLYSLYKALSAIAYAAKYKQIYPQFNFIPVYWVEDSDDDIDEVNKYSHLDNNYDLHTLKIDNVIKRKLSHFELNNSITNIIQSILSDKQDDIELNKIISSIAENCNLLPDNFIDSINYFTNDYGLLFVKSSEVYKHKFYNDIIIEDLLNPGKISSIVEENNTILHGHHYTVQAYPSDINFFFSSDDKRHKIVLIGDSYNFNSKNLSKDEIFDFIQNTDTVFTPKVLLRPIIQDYLFPTAAYVGGPGEIAYMAQISKLYDNFNIKMPIILARHSFTIINNFINRNIEKENIELKSIIQDYKLIEREMASHLVDEEIDKVFNKIASEIKSLYKELSPVILETDKSLATNIDLTVNKSVELLQNLQKKVVSQVKRKNETRFSRISKCNKFVYPNNKLQERELNIFNLINDHSKNGLIEKLMHYTSQDANYHYVVNLDL